MQDLYKFPALLKLLPELERGSQHNIELRKIRLMSKTELHQLTLELEKSIDRNRHLYIHNDMWMGTSSRWGLDGSALNEEIQKIREVINRICNIRHEDTIVHTLKTGLDYFERQRLTQICRLFSAEAIEKRKSWIAEWRSEFDTKYKKAMFFLTSKGRWNQSISYNFSNVNHSYETSAVVPLIEEYYDAMSAVARLAEGYFADPKYKLGDMVELRSAHSNAFHLKVYSLDTYEVAWKIRKKLEDMQQSRRGFLTIIEVDPMVPLASRRGNKLYKVILAGETQPLLVEEGLIKKIRGIKKKKKKGDK